MTRTLSPPAPAEAIPIVSPVVVSDRGSEPASPAELSSDHLADATRTEG